MALTKCKECTHKVSTTAPACPNCGAPDFILKNIRWRKGYCPDLIAKRLESCAERDSSKKVVGFNGFETSSNLSVLHSMLNFGASHSVPETDARSIIWEAAVQAGGGDKITTDSLLLEINRSADKYMKRPLERYVLVTSLSLLKSISLPKNRVQFRGPGSSTVIMFGSDLPRKYREAATPIIIAQTEKVSSAKYRNTFLPTRVYVSARSLSGAAEEALNTLDLVRGIWNLFHNMPIHNYRYHADRCNDIR